MFIVRLLVCIAIIVMAVSCHTYTPSKPLVQPTPALKKNPFVMPEENPIRGGMTMEEVRRLWGYPKFDEVRMRWSHPDIDDVRRYSNEKRRMGYVDGKNMEQWQYPRNTSVIFHDGIVAAIYRPEKRF
jgi:hypothetical protein